MKTSWTATKNALPKRNINEALFEWLETADQADVVLIAGDLSFNGEKESNEAFSKLLHDFKEKSGKKVYVVTAGHDFNDAPFCFRESGKETVEGTKFPELYSYYGDFGYKDAVAFNAEHLSYVAELSEDVRLLVLCNDVDGKKHVAYDDEFLGWIESQAKKAQADGNRINLLQVQLDFLQKLSVVRISKSPAKSIPIDRQSIACIWGNNCIQKHEKPPSDDSFGG